ncbi:hypothetical protein [Kordia sp.]|uniref:hypothetical protein n=1 Tax=Kordia sp. TaxID=1965332 RepID=UPI003D6A702C
MKTDIIKLCKNLNRQIHNPLFHNFYNIPDQLNYNQTFTSIDLVEDSQIAIEEFENIDIDGIQGRSTLLIYGLLQSFFLQHDGLFYLYKCIVNRNIKRDDFFNLFSFDKNIREVRNDIAGHPTNRHSSEFYFIAKGTTTKYEFTYAGYTPEFRTVDVDLKIFIQKQFDFAEKVLLFIQNNIKQKIEMKKEEHKNIKLSEMIIEADRNIQLISRGIRDGERSFEGEWGISGVEKSIQNLKKELALRYNSNLPASISESFRMIDHILLRFREWDSENLLLNNDDAEIFLDSLDNQISELSEMLKEVDEEFNT